MECQRLVVGAACTSGTHQHLVSNYTCVVGVTVTRLGLGCIMRSTQRGHSRHYKQTKGGGGGGGQAFRSIQWW